MMLIVSSNALEAVSSPSVIDALASAANVRHSSMMDVHDTHALAGLWRAAFRKPLRARHPEHRTLDPTTVCIVYFLPSL